MRTFFRDLAEAFRVAMCKMNEIQFSAPWNVRAGGC